MNHQSLIRWLRECYREDHTRAGVRDFFAASVENRKIVKGEERLACGFLGEDVLSPAYANKLLANLSLHRREKEYLYGCLFFIGRIEGKIYRSPLILYPAKARRTILTQITETATIDHALYRLNYSLLDLLDNKSEIEQAILDALSASNGVLTGLAVSEIANAFLEFMPEVKVNKLMEWPYLTSATGVNKNVGEGLKIIPAAGWGVVKRSAGSSGVVDELDKLGGLKQLDWSAALRSLFDGGKVRAAEELPSIAPVLLSETQEHILKSARGNDLTVCHGPPGTGKSFTLAAIAIDHIARGKSVLVVSKKDHAVDVIFEKISELLRSDKAIVRAGRSNYLKSLKDRVSNLLSKRHTVNSVEENGVEKIVNELLSVLKEIKNEEKQLGEEYRKSIERGEVSAKPNPKWYEKIIKLWHERQVKGRPILIELTNHLAQLHQKKENIVRQLIHAQQNHLTSSVMTKNTSRKDMKNLLTGLKKRKSSEQLKAFYSANFNSILRVFPIWITSLSDLHRVLPPTKEMFDVVIIDEASQCDIASALPAIQRAKRVVIAGDAKQLRHVAFIANSSMEKYARDLDLTELVQEKHNYRNVSLMDLAIENTNDVNQVALLDEHFRSLKPIIEFSNLEFYLGALRLMRDRPWEAVSSKSLEFKYCGPSGRGEDGVNKEEVQAVMDDLEKLLKPTAFLGKAVKSIGILSPFRSQVDALAKAVIERFQSSVSSNLLSKYQLKIGTAHSFQGAERDVMLISMALGNSDNAGARRFAEQEDVFNVSITRAKHQQIVYHSVQPSDLPANSLLGKYIATTGKSSTAIEKEIGREEIDEFAQQLSAVCKQRQITCRVNQSVASIPVDVLLEKSGKYLGVDLVGYPGFMQAAVEIKRHQILERAGMILVPVGYVEWQVQQEKVIAALEKLLS